MTINPADDITSDQYVDSREQHDIPLSVVIDITSTMNNFAETIASQFGYNTELLLKAPEDFTEEEKKQERDLYAKIAEIGPDFYANLAPIDNPRTIGGVTINKGAMYFWDYLTNHEKFVNNPERIWFLSTYEPENQHAATEGNRRWIEKHLGVKCTDDNYFCVPREKFLGDHEQDETKKWAFLRQFVRKDKNRNILIHDRFDEVKAWFQADPEHTAAILSTGPLDNKAEIRAIIKYHYLPTEEKEALNEAVRNNS